MMIATRAKPCPMPQTPWRPNDCGLILSNLFDYLFNSLLLELLLLVIVKLIVD